MAYQPQPIDTSNVELPDSITPLIEKLAEHNHDVWAMQRITDGWKFGPERNDDRMEHPDLIAYKDLPDREKQYDRNSAMEILKAIVALGYCIEKT